MLSSHLFWTTDLRLIIVVVFLLLFLTFSAMVANPKKTTLHGGQSRSWSAEQGKKEKEKLWEFQKQNSVCRTFL